MAASMEVRETSTRLTKLAFFIIFHVINVLEGTTLIRYVYFIKVSKFDYNSLHLLLDGLKYEH